MRTVFFKETHEEIFEEISKILESPDSLEGILGKREVVVMEDAE